MTEQDEIKLIQDWMDSINRVEKINYKLMEILGLQPESELLDASWNLINHYTKAVGEIIGDDEDDSWLDWFYLQTRFGKIEMEVIFQDGEKLTPKTASDIHKVIKKQ